MKHLPAVILGLACVALAVLLFVNKRDDNAQHEKDAEAITSVSNLLSSAQTEVDACKETISTLSNRLETCQSTSLTISNELMEAKSAQATAKEDLDRQSTDLNGQITELNRRITQSESEKQASTKHLADMANQITELTNQIASARASLLQASKDYALLENRFRRDVAQRVLAERKFYNRTELKAQLEYLQWNPAREISEDRIREGLNVVVGKSNLCYVIAAE
jgi:predicted  nucleic acid-binding Zn-ribbon protein